MNENVIGTPLSASLGENVEISSRRFLGTRSRKVCGNGITVQRDRKNSPSWSSVQSVRLQAHPWVGRASHLAP
ncbi:hypothetical protein QTJ16_003660 [Diplocarpon rosae]|uniref:Uncharacterized protein n=1 Tax=Diplocarpon rosae TaxID=946125 RepID=A0AAD9SZG6_9HELO|nr:hypothetical protein QTJ16_003660 [Diplocarpon rosae]